MTVILLSLSSIEWTTRTWNPTVGCTKVSDGCKFCYASILHARLKAMGQEKYIDDFNTVKIYLPHLMEPYKWKKPCRVFVNSMSDLFHEDIPLWYLKAVFRVMNENPHLQFQVLTKRSERLMQLSNELTWTDNIWMGVSVENEKVKFRIDHLRKTGAKVKFLSLEPLLTALPKMNLKNIDWVIVGGESGIKSRPIEEPWVQVILKQCRAQGVPFFFKQWGGKNKKAAGRLLNGRTYDEYPVELQT